MRIARSVERWKLSLIMVDWIMNIFEKYMIADNAKIVVE